LSTETLEQEASQSDIKTSEISSGDKSGDKGFVFADGDGFDDLPVKKEPDQKEEKKIEPLDAHEKQALDAEKAKQEAEKKEKESDTEQDDIDGDDDSDSDDDDDFADEDDDYKPVLPKIVIKDKEVTDAAIDKHIRSQGGDPEKADDFTRKMVKNYLHSQIKSDQRQTVNKEYEKLHKDLTARLDKLERNGNNVTQTEKADSTKESKQEEKVLTPQGEQKFSKVLALMDEGKKDEAIQEYEKLRKSDQETILKTVRDELRAEQAQANKEQKDKALQQEVQEIELHNENTINEYVKDLLAEAYTEAGQLDKADIYKDSQYQITQDDLTEEIQQRVTQIYEFINSDKGYRLNKGRFDLSHMKRAERELDPQSFEKRKRAQTRKRREAALKKAKPDKSIVNSKRGTRHKGFKLDERPDKSSVDYHNQLQTLSDEDLHDLRIRSKQHRQRKI
jgi:hypothetical protein